jgi:antitoxin component of MazEF toxin-antitoxin module
MNKKLITIGNSVAIVLDKALRNALGIKATTLVRVMTDGQRIIIEPSGERTKEATHTVAVSERMRAIQIGDDLLKRFSMGNELFSQLTCGWPRPRPSLSALHYVSWLQRVPWEELTDAEVRVIRRFEIVYRELSKRPESATWPEAIETALAVEPLDRDDPGEQSVGSSAPL